MEQQIDDRRRTARVLANASEDELARLWDAWTDRPDVTYLRGPEAGLVMVQGRIGGTGDRFNLGEATVSRSTVLAHGQDEEVVGTAYVLGSHPEHSRLAAIFDALLQSAQRSRVLREVIDPLELAQRERDQQAQAEARSTVVDFFTVARESNGMEDDDE